MLDMILGTLNAKEFHVKKAHGLISEIQKVHRFEDVYRLLGFTYVVDNSGKINYIEKASFDVVVSAGVLEYVDEYLVSELVKRIAFALKPGDYSYHSINLRDHLYFYDRSVSSK